MAHLEIREATADDAPGLAGVHVRSWQVGYLGIVPDEVLDGLSVATRERQWREWIEQGTWIRVACRDGLIVGLCAVLRTGDDPANGEVAALYVDPPAFRTGVGTALLNTALAHLSAAAAQQVTLWVFTGNARARAFYARYGFAPDGGSDEHISGAPELRLRAALTG
ncbi:MAG: GNAT family N-acetyltransferase [Solirubrobacteraceae bacterium]